MSLITEILICVYCALNILYYPWSLYRDWIYIKNSNKNITLTDMEIARRIKKEPEMKEMIDELVDAILKMRLRLDNIEASFEKVDSDEDITFTVSASKGETK